MQAMFITRLCRKELCSTEYNRDQRIALERKVRKITVLNSQVWEVAILERVNSLGLKVRSRPRSKTRIQEGRNGTLETNRKLGGKLMPIGKVTQQNWERRGTKRGAETKEKGDAERKEQNEQLNRARPRERQMLADICMQHKPQSVPEKYFIVPEERIYSGTWYYFLPLWIKNRSAFK